MTSMGEKFCPMIKHIRMNWMTLQAASTLDGGCEVVRNSTMESHHLALTAKPAGVHMRSCHAYIASLGR